MKSRAAVVSALVATLAMPLLVTAPNAAAESSNRLVQPALEIGQLTVEHQDNPLGIDVARPRLSWTLNSDVLGSRQSAYQVQVFSAPNGTGKVWDSGKVSSAKSFDVEYGGPDLRSRTRYYWRVRVWNATHQASAWSDTKWFETAFLKQADFHGNWIGARAESPTASLQGASWIWYPEGNPADSAPVGTRYFRRTLDLSAEVSAAHFQLTADDNFVLYVNGKQLARSPQINDSWRSAVDVDLTAALHVGRNVIAVQAANAQPGPSGLVGKLQLSGADPIDLVTDASWKSSNVELTGWQAPDFDDSAWPAALVAAAYGSSPWGNSVTPTTPPEPLLRKDFAAQQKRIRSARAYVAGLGYYKLYLNGQRVGDHELDPGFTVYDKTVLYATYDVTEQLRSGANAIGVSLGRGYYAMTNPDEWVTSPWHGEPKLKLQLDVTYVDGTTEQILSDGSWTLADGPTTSESLWFGETYDARLEQPGWNNTGFDDSGWRPASVVPAPTGKLTAQSFPPIKVTGQLPAGKVSEPAAGTTVHDYGSPTAGWATVALRGPAGAQVTITYGEKLKSDGTVDNIGGFGMQLQKYTYVLKGSGLETYTPSYSYAGFQYVQVTAPEGVTVESVSAKRVHTAAAQTGNFTSSSDLLNRYHAAEANTILNNLHSVPTDTPMYEKRPYTADGFLSADSAIASFDLRNFYENWMRSHRDDQTPEGNIGQTVPGTAGAKQVVDPVWTASFVLINWDLYWYYGDLRPLQDNYEPMKAWLKFFETKIAQTGYIYTGGSYADWLAPGFAQPPEGARLAGTAYLLKTTTAMAEIARALGHTDDAAHFDRLAATITDAFNATFLDSSTGAYYDDRAAGYRQTSNLLPLSLGIVPAAKRAAVVAKLVADINDRGVHLNTGALGTKLILPVLSDTGNAELAYRVATNPTYPGWGYWFQSLGATTMWEEWAATSRSRQHAFMGTVDDWLYQRVAGIEPAAPGYTKVKVQPYPVGDLRQASAEVASPLGQVRSAWTRDEGRFTVRVSVPVGATGEIFVPVRPGDQVVAPAGATFESRQDGYAKYQVGSGSYEFQAVPVPAVSTIVNGDAGGPTVRFATGGDAVDAHDGEIQKFGARYYLYGTSYGCGFEWQKPGSPFCGFKSYSSTDLVHWTDEGFLFDATTSSWQQRCDGGTYGCYRPHVVYNKATRKYVLWINSYDVGVGYHVFTADRPNGPFTEQAIPKLAVNNDIPPGVNNGDHDVFRDTDGTAYLAYTDWRRGGDIVVEKLDASYRTGTGEHVRLGVQSTEAPSMFKRNGTYYLTLSDPNCGYCTTGTSYFRAPTPLGPWQGSTSDAAWQIQDQALQVNGGGVGLSKGGAQWADYDLSFRTVPQQTGGGGSYAQAGWTFRATDTGTGYVWMLGNYPHPGAEGGSLTKAVFRNGAVQKLEIVKTPMPIVGGQPYAVRTQVEGSTIRTWVNGTLVDTTTDTSYATGRIGFRESGGNDGESARFDDVRVTAPDGTQLLADDFTGDLSSWLPPATTTHGVKISTDSCGGQPADVAELPGRDGPVYLYQSDRWNDRAPNEALAKHQWEPLRFRADGSIEPLQCGDSYDLNLTDTSYSPPTVHGVSAGDDGFHTYCDLAAGISRAQTFTMAGPGKLRSVAFTTFQSGRPNAPLTLELARLDADGKPGAVIATRTIAPTDVSWSPSRVILPARVKDADGERFALIARTTTTTGCYGHAYNDSDPLPNGIALYSNNNGTTWQQEPSRDLRINAS